MPQESESTLAASSLFNAAFVGDLDQVIKHLDNRSDPDELSAENVTPLMVAAQKGHYQVSKTLLNAGANADFRHSSGQSVLWTAVETGDVNTVSLLLSYNIDVNAIAHKASPLWLAVQHGYVDVIKVLLSNKSCDINLSTPPQHQTPLYKAIQSGNLTITLLLIHANADVNIADCDGRTPLMLAMTGDLSVHIKMQMVKALIIAGANIHAVDKIGKSVLFWAHEEKLPLVAEQLMQAGVYPDLSYQWLHQQFLKYTDILTKLRPNQYHDRDIIEVKNIIQLGLCFAYSMYLITLNENEWSSFFNDLAYISQWDGAQSSYVNDKKLQVLLEEILGILFWFQKGNQILHKSERGRSSSLINIITDNRKKELVFNFGFLLDFKEIENILSLILKPGKKIEVAAIVDDMTAHSLLLTKSSNGMFWVCDNQSSVGPMQLDSYHSVVKTIFLMLNHNYECLMGISFLVYDPICSPDKFIYKKLKTSILNEILEGRLAESTLNRFNHIMIDAFTIAVFSNDEETVSQLLENGISIRQNTPYQLSPVYIAATAGSVNLLKKIVCFFPSIDLDGVYDEFPLLAACCEQHIEVVKYLISQGVTINRRGAHGATPLIYASQNGDLETVTALVDGGADVNYSMADGNSPLFMACKGGHVTVVEFLAARGAVIDNLDYRALDVAIYEGHLHVIETLAKLDIDFSLKNISGLSPLAMARHVNKPNIEKFISIQLQKKLVQPGLAQSFFKAQSTEIHPSETLAKLTM